MYTFRHFFSKHSKYKGVSAYFPHSLHIRYMPSCKNNNNYLHFHFIFFVGCSIGLLYKNISFLFLLQETIIICWNFLNKTIMRASNMRNTFTPSGITSWNAFTPRIIQTTCTKNKLSVPYCLQCAKDLHYLSVHNCTCVQRILFPYYL